MTLIPKHLYRGAYFGVVQKQFEVILMDNSKDKTTGGATRLFNATIGDLELKYNDNRDNLHRLAAAELPKDSDGWKDQYLIALRSLNDFAAVIHEQDFGVKNDFDLDKTLKSGKTLCERIDEHFVYSEKVQDNPITTYHHLLLVENLLLKAGRKENESSLQVAKVFLEKTNPLYMNLTHESVVQFVNHGMRKITAYRALPENSDKEAAWQDIVMYFSVRTAEAGDQMLKLASEDYCRNRDKMNDLLQQNSGYQATITGDNTAVGKQKKKTGFWRMATAAGLVLGGLAVSGTYSIMQGSSGNTESSESINPSYQKMVGCVPQEKIIAEQKGSIKEQQAKARVFEQRYTGCEGKLTELQGRYDVSTAAYTTLKENNSQLQLKNEQLQREYRSQSNNCSTLVTKVRENIDNRNAIILMAADYIRNASGTVRVNGLSCSNKAEGIYNLWIEGAHHNSFLPEEKEKITGHLEYFCEEGDFKCSEIIVK